VACSRCSQHAGKKRRSMYKWTATSLDRHTARKWGGGRDPRTSLGTIFVCGASDFSHFFDMAACPNHTTTSSYRCILGLTKRSPVIPTQTFSLHNTKYHISGTYSPSDVKNQKSRDQFTHHYYLLVRLRYHDIRNSAVDPAHRIANTIIHYYAVRL